MRISDFFEIKQELLAIRITPAIDIISEAKSNVLTVETEILLYDIYVCLIRRDR